MTTLEMWGIAELWWLGSPLLTKLILVIIVCMGL